MKKGYLALILHAHLPFVRHPELARGVLEEFWFYEAMYETYLPLIYRMERLRDEGVSFRLSLVLSPTLTAMLQDPLLQERFLEYMKALTHLAEKELEITYGDEGFHSLAWMYHDLIRDAKNTYHKHNGDLTKAFSSLQEDGFLELLTCGATHAYLPLLYTKEGMRAQIGVAVHAHQRVYGRKPRGLWLPECGFREEILPILKEFGVEYFFMESHGILYAHPRPKYGTYTPIMTPQEVAAFGRDLESSKQVWSANEGYPGDYQYREFYRDIGYEREEEHLKPFFFDGLRKQTGIKYYRITGETEKKEIYHREEGMKKAREHAGNFMFNRQRQIEYLYQRMDGRKPIIVAPYDAELFGHWWFEGPIFLEELLRRVHRDQDDIALITPGEYLDMAPSLQVALPTSSSWGYKGYHEVWLEGSNDWIYRHLHEGEKRMVELTKEFIYPSPLEERALNQLLRELMLAQSSDWAFIMKTGTMVEYAKKRVLEHMSAFLQLSKDLKEGSMREEWLKDLEEKNPLFLDLDHRIFAAEREPAYL